VEGKLVKDEAASGVQVQAKQQPQPQQLPGRNRGGQHPRQRHLGGEKRQQHQHQEQQQHQQQQQEGVGGEASGASSERAAAVRLGQAPQRPGGLPSPVGREGVRFMALAATFTFSGLEHLVFHW